jgi:hypothetical protein
LLERYRTELLSSTAKEVISARNSVDAHAQSFVVNDEWLLHIFRALAQCTRSLELFDVLSLYSSRTVAPTNGSLVPPKPYTQPPNRARHAHPCGDHLIFCRLYFGANEFEYKLPEFSGSPHSSHTNALQDASIAFFRVLTPLYT